MDRPISTRRSRNGSAAPGLLLVIAVVCAAGLGGLGTLGRGLAADLRGSGAARWPRGAMVLSAAAGTGPRVPAPDAFLIPNLERLGPPAPDGVRTPGTFHLGPAVAERLARITGADQVRHGDVYQHMVHRVSLLYPPTAVLFHGDEVGELWRGMAMGVVDWVKEVGGSFLALLNPKNHEASKGRPLPIGLSAALLHGLGYVVTHPVDVVVFVGRAVSGMFSRFAEITRGCLLDEGAAYDVGHQCGEIGAEIASYSVGSKVGHVLLESDKVPRMFRLGHTAEKWAAGTAAGARSSATITRWLADRALGLAPHLLDDGPRVLVRGVRREEVKEAHEVEVAVSSSP